MTDSSPVREPSVRGPSPGRIRPVVIGHRGACGYRPEHTLASYRLAIEQGAGFIEPDVVSTRDGVLVARHEHELSATTDVARRPDLAPRRTTRSVDGVPVTGWFTEDLTLEEIKSLRAVERFGALRPASAAHDGRGTVATLQEVIDLVRAAGSGVGICPETKHASHFRRIGLPLEEPLVEILHANGYRGPGDRAFIQSFDGKHLRRLRALTAIPLVQLVGCPPAPAAPGSGAAPSGLVTPAGLVAVRSYAAGIGACKDLLVPRDAAGALTAPSPVIADAHRAGLLVYTWTMRVENRFLPAERRRGPDPGAPGDLAGEIAAFLAAGVDGFATDNPDIGVAAVDRLSG